jgi:hypothetical protein
MKIFAVGEKADHGKPPIKNFVPKPRVSRKKSRAFLKKSHAFLENVPARVKGFCLPANMKVCREQYKNTWPIMYLYN